MLPDNLIHPDENSNKPALTGEKNSAEPDAWQHISEPVRRITRRIGGKIKFGPDHRYSEAELALFLAYRGNREFHRPRQCTGGANCWVDKGPQGWSTKPHKGMGGCVDCGGAPRFRS